MKYIASAKKWFSTFMLKAVIGLGILRLARSNVADEPGELDGIAGALQVLGHALECATGRHPAKDAVKASIGQADPLPGFAVTLLEAAFPLYV